MHPLNQDMQNLHSDVCTATKHANTRPNLAHSRTVARPVRRAS
jgi:hypothetical protein